MYYLSLPGGMNDLGGALTFLFMAQRRLWGQQPQDTLRRGRALYSPGEGQLPKMLSRGEGGR